MSANAPSQTVYSIGYDFHVGNGNNGNVFGITNYKDQNRNQTFTYDALNRLISAQNAGTDCGATVIGGRSEYWGNSYGYDAWGNLLQKSIIKCGAESLSVTADGHNWIHASGTDYQYDAAGNMTFNATPPTQNYTYDQENRLTGAAGYPLHLRRRRQPRRQVQWQHGNALLVYDSGDCRRKRPERKPDRRICFLRQ